MSVQSSIKELWSVHTYFSLALALCLGTLGVGLILTAKVEIVAEPSSTNNKLQDNSTSTAAIDTTSIILSTKLITISKWGFRKSSLYIKKQLELKIDFSENLCNRSDSCIDELQKPLVKKDSFLLELEAVKLFFSEADSIFRNGFMVKDAPLFEDRLKLNPDSDLFTGNGVEMMIFYMDWIIKHRDDISAEDIIDHFEKDRRLLSVSDGLKRKVDALSLRSGFFTPGGLSECSPTSSSEYVTGFEGVSSCGLTESVSNDELAAGSSEGSFNSLKSSFEVTSDSEMQK